MHPSGNEVAAIQKLQNVTRYLTKGATTTASTQNTKAAEGAVVVASGHINGATASWTAKQSNVNGQDVIYARLKVGEDRNKWLISFKPEDGSHRYDIPGGQWEVASALQVSNQEAGFTYWVAENGHQIDGTEDISLFTFEHATVYEGDLGDGIVDIDALAAAVVARLLPTGGTDGQFLSRASSAPAWVAAPAGGGAGGGPSFNSVATGLAIASGEFTLSAKNSADIFTAIALSATQGLRITLKGGAGQNDIRIPIMIWLPEKPSAGREMYVYAAFAGPEPNAGSSTQKSIYVGRLWVIFDRIADPNAVR